MRRILTLLPAALLMAQVASAQDRSAPMQESARFKEKRTVDQGFSARPGSADPSQRGGGPLWSDDFSNPSNWTIGYAPGSPALLWQIGVGLSSTGDFPIATIQSTTADNGFAMVDSDAFANQSLVESSFITTASPIDLSGVDNVVIQFESFYRKWTNEECYLVLSTNNTDWPALTPTTDITNMPNVFKVWPGMAVQAPVSNPTLVRINISQAAGDQQQVWVRFHWTGTYGYSWYVDDVAIYEQPANDLIMEDGFFSTTMQGEEYGRIPSHQLFGMALVGGSFLNFGYETQTQVSVNMQLRNAANQVVLTASENFPLVQPGQTDMMEQTVTLPDLPNSLYTATYTVTSAEEQSGLFFANNSYLRSFEITDDVYSLDGLGNHPAGYQGLGSLGTNSFEDGAEGLKLFTYYPIQGPLEIVGMEVLLTSTTQDGGALTFSIHDTSDVFTSNVFATLYESDLIDVTPQHVTNGRIIHNFAQPLVLNDGGYCAAVTLYGGEGSHIRVLDDLTVPQPALASAIYIENDQVYTNGNAFAIRLLLGIRNISVGEAASFSSRIFPNPTEGHLRVTADVKGNALAEVMDVLGSVVMAVEFEREAELSLAHLPKGMYMVRVSHQTSARTHRIALH